MRENEREEREDGWGGVRERHVGRRKDRRDGGGVVLTGDGGGLYYIAICTFV